MNWMRVKYAHLGESGGMPHRIFLEICCSEIESGGFGYLLYPGGFSYTHTYMLYFVIVGYYILL